MLSAKFDLQGHRGARGLKPENTLPAFEAALDLGVTTIETDLHLSRDGVPVIAHDPCISERLCRRPETGAVPEPSSRPALATLTFEQIRGYRADRNPDPTRFPNQDASVTPLARLFAQQHGIDAYSMPSLSDFLAFTALYSGTGEQRASKSKAQCERARMLRFDLELKRVPFQPESIGDGFDGSSLAVLERALLQQLAAADVLDRTTVRSFDHRCVRLVKQEEPRLQTAVLVAGTLPLEPELLARSAGADIYGPEYTFLDQAAVERLHSAGVRVVPWTVNDPDAMKRLLDWGVDGITTDYPDRLADILRKRRITF